MTTEDNNDGADARMLAAWPVRARPAAPLTALELFAWAVVRQSNVGPGVATAASAFGVTPERIRDLVRAWDDPRGHMECERVGDSRFASWRIDAYYNTSGG